MRDSTEVITVGEERSLPNRGIGRRIQYVDIDKSYGSIAALKPTNLTIEPGEFFSIIGPSGSGKTTLLGLTAGFIIPSNGKILIGDQSIEGIPTFKRNIGMVFQNYSLFPHKTVGQNIAFPLRMRGVSKAESDERVKKSLRLVRLANVADRYPGSLSGGQQQRVALARASIYSPSLLVMDEPLSALDKTLREEMQYEIKQLHRNLGCTVLYVTHDQAEAAAMANRIAIMDAGEIVQIGSARELYSLPRNRFVASFLGQANLLAVESIEPTPVGVVAKTLALPRVKSTARFHDQKDLSVCVRPEAIVISPSELAMDNVVKGVVMDSIFTNGMQRHRVRLQDNSIIEQWQQLTSDTYAADIGREVHLGWSAKDTLLVNNI